ncbi:MAG: hypothetical protein IJO32_02285 [Bacilli bacterium]|nr:hypothetical protein [Bacilli bacterium]
MREVFIKYLNKNNFNKVIFEYILKDLKSERQIDLLEKVILKYPNLELTNLNLELFNEKYIDCFGMDFLSKNITTLKKIYLDYGLKDEDIKKRLFIISDLNIPFDNINPKLLLSTIINDNNIIEISEFLNDKLFSYFICNCCLDDEKYLNIILKCIDKNSDYYKLIIIILNRFEQREYNKFEKILFNNNISDYINFFQNIEMSWFNIKTKFDEVLKIFENNKNLFNEINKLENKKCIKEKLKIYFYDNSIKINSIEELNKIGILRYKNFRDKIININNIDEIKNLFVKCYFNLDITKFESIIKNVEENISDGLILNDYNMYIFRILKYFVSSNKKEILLILFDDLFETPNIYEYIQRLDEIQKKYCFNDISNSLTKVGNESKIIEFNGQDFNFLVHKIKGYGNRHLANKLYDDPSLWDKNYIEDSYISTSMITNNYFGCVPGNGYILAFNNIEASDILDIGCEDISYSIKYYKNNIKLPKSRIMTGKNLIKNSRKAYNEVVIKRFKNNKAIMPSGVVAFDKVTEKDVNVAKHFNVPIYLINRKKYLSKMIEECNYYFNIGDYDNYCNYRTKIALSFSDNNKIMKEHFNIDKLNENTNLIIEQIFNDLKVENNIKKRKRLINSLKNMIKVNYKINSIMKYYDITYKNYTVDEKTIEKRLNLYLDTQKSI